MEIGGGRVIGDWRADLLLIIPKLHFLHSFELHTCVFKIVSSLVSAVVRLYRWEGSVSRGPSTRFRHRALHMNVLLPYLRECGLIHIRIHSI